MRKLLIPLAIAPLFAAGAALAEPGPWYGHSAYYESHNARLRLNDDQRLALQREAIERGIARGAITRYEAERLFEENARIARMKQIAKADGYFTLEERARYSQALDASARHIRLAINDRDRRRHY
jgi:hypothetical protein